MRAHNLKFLAHKPKGARGLLQVFVKLSVCLGLCLLVWNHNGRARLAVGVEGETKMRPSLVAHFVDELVEELIITCCRVFCQSCDSNFGFVLEGLSLGINTVLDIHVD